MFKLTLRQIADAVKCTNFTGDREMVFDTVSTNSKKIPPGCLFVALRGERFDGHDFVHQALELGAGGLLVHRPVTVPEGTPVIQVRDTLCGLQELAKFNRSQFAGPLVAVTGSNGKTTTKDILFSLLSEKFKVLKTAGNFNNEIGLPLTLLELDESYEAAVIEMGMRGLGEIDLLASIAGPTAGIITNIGETHLERLGTVENIARAKTELLPHLPSGGYAVLNGDDPWLRKYAHLAGCKVIFYGMDANSDIFADKVLEADGLSSDFEAVFNGQGRRFTLPIPGRHNIYNALAAVAVGLMEGLTWEQCAEGLKKAELTGMRLQNIEHAGVQFINDTYNANPASTKASLEILAKMPAEGKRVAVVGDMYELGDRTVEGHREVGETAVRLGIDIIISVGDLAEDIYKGAIEKGLHQDAGFHCSSNLEAVALLKRLIRSGDRVLVKGSRGMKMEEIVQALTQTGNQ